MSPKEKIVSKILLILSEIQEQIRGQVYFFPIKQEIKKQVIAKK
jgi:hypothetical protein